MTRKAFISPVTFKHLKIHQLLCCCTVVMNGAVLSQIMNTTNYNQLAEDCGVLFREYILLHGELCMSYPKFLELFLEGSEVLSECVLCGFTGIKTQVELHLVYALVSLDHHNEHVVCIGENCQCVCASISCEHQDFVFLPDCSCCEDDFSNVEVDIWLPEH